YNLRSTNSNILERSSIRTGKTTGDRAFQVAAPVVWNSLPQHVRAATCILTSKKFLKTHLFNLAYF
ncbi:predicted protein, partial [Nematostella vectensis]